MKCIDLSYGLYFTDGTALLLTLSRYLDIMSSKFIMLADKLEDAFYEFCRMPMRSRNIELPRLDALISAIERVSTDNYLRGKCSDLRNTTRRMAMLRQPRCYDDRGEIVFALGDLQVIRSLFEEQQSTYQE